MLGFEDFKKLKGADFYNLTLEDWKELERLHDAEPEQYAQLDAEFRESFEVPLRSRRRAFFEKCLSLMEENGDTGNPFHAWSQWKFARQRGLRPPDWVLRYSDQAGDSILALVDEKPERLSTALQKALGFTAGRRPSHLAEYRTGIEHFNLAMAVAKHQRETGDRLTPASSRSPRRPISAR